MSTQGYDPSTGYMDFSLALREMKKGKKVRRASWDAGIWLCMKDVRLVWVSDGREVEFNNARLGDQQLLATDWEEVL